jgi:hypothetical protein
MYDTVMRTHGTKEINTSQKLRLNLVLAVLLMIRHSTEKSEDKNEHIKHKSEDVPRKFWVRVKRVK